ncbi:MAG: hypothetical protein ABI425_05505 [Patescibacteria group bacterium]
MGAFLYQHKALDPEFPQGVLVSIKFGDYTKNLSLEQARQAD